uniref:Vacuolar protein sorting-associated protein 51 homolog n=1 Tax=Meloidogyne hapla TaxID=6305 RepID=A0A1I8BTD2_MELHA
MSFSASSKSTLNINSTNFDAEYYVQDLLRKKGLEELVAVEQDMVNNVRRLDSEMQSLVYENYSKFLNATSTVKDMQNRLTDAHNEMHSLSSRMNRITDLSDFLTEKFAKNCERVKKLNEARDSVKRLEFLIKAPQILQKCVENNDMSKAVNTYVSIQPKLEKLKNLPSMSGIASDSEKIIEGVKKQLSEQLERRLISSEAVIQAVQLLKKLGIPENELENQLISTFEREIYSELNKLKEEENEQIPGELLTNIKFNDIFEFVDTGCCHFLTNVSLMASTFLQLFNKQHSRAEFAHLLERVMTIFEQIVDKRFGNETNSADCSLFVKALDRICRKISVLARLSPDFSFTRMNSSIVHRAAKHQIILCRQFVGETIQKAVNEAFQKLNNSTPLAFSSSRSDNGQFYSSAAGSTSNNARKTFLKELLDKIEHCVLHSIKSALASLLMFTATDIIFSSIPHFTAIFGFDVHEQIVIGSIQDLSTNINLRINSLTENEEEGKGTELLILCALLRNLRLKHLEYLLELAQQQYRLSEFHFSNQYKLTNIETPTNQLQETIEKLLRKYVQIESLALSKISNKCISTFEWAECSETPQRVRTLIKHLVRSVAEKDVDLAALMENDGFTSTKERTPESSHGYYTMRRAASAASSVYNNNNDNNSSLGGSDGGIVERLWGDDDTEGEENKNVEGAKEEFLKNLKVEFRRDIIMNALIRLLSLSLCEYVRAQPKFSRNGLEQLQVDCAYMRQKLWAHAGDEHMLNMSIEDVVTAAVNQCAQPKLLDPSVVRAICEEN